MKQKRFWYSVKIEMGLWIFSFISCFEREMGIYIVLLIELSNYSIYDGVILLYFYKLKYMSTPLSPRSTVITIWTKSEKISWIFWNEESRTLINSRVYKFIFGILRKIRLSKAYLIVFIFLVQTWSSFSSKFFSVACSICAISRRRFVT